MAQIFNTPLCNLEEATACAAAIKALESQMQASTELPAGKQKYERHILVEIEPDSHDPPEPELYAISTWRCRAINALVKDPQIEEGRQSAIDWLTERLGGLLHLFSKISNNASSRKFLPSIREKIIVPAIRLHELMICERDLYRLEFNHYTPSSDARGTSSATASEAFFESLGKLNCLEIQGSKRVPLEPENLPVDAQELQRRLVKLCAVTPALLTQHISDKHDYRCAAERVLVKQQVLVLMGAPKRDRNKKRTFLHDLAFPDPALVFQAVWK